MESLGVSGEHRCLADVLKTTEELHDTLETETSTGVARCTVLESIDVVLEGLDGDALRGGSLGKHRWVVHTLRT